MARKHRRRGKRRILQFVHNIRPAMALSDSPKRSAMPLMTVGMLIVVLALMFGLIRIRWADNPPVTAAVTVPVGAHTMEQ